MGVGEKPHRQLLRQGDLRPARKSRTAEPAATLVPATKPQVGCRRWLQGQAVLWNGLCADTDHDPLTTAQNPNSSESFMACLNLITANLTGSELTGNKTRPEGQEDTYGPH